MAARWRHALLLGAAILLTAPWFNIALDNADGAGMLAHLQGFFRDFDLLYDDDYATFEVLPIFAYVTREGVVSNHWPIGATFLQAPGYLAGKGAAAMLDRGGHALPLLGLRTWALMLLLATALGIWRWFGGRAGLLVAAALVIGTPALYYAAEAPSRPHLYGAVVVTAAMWIWHGRRGDASTSRLVLLSATCGLAASIRPQLAPLVLLAAEVAWRDAAGPERRLRRLSMAAAAFVPWPLLVFSVQIWMYGGGLLEYAGGTVTHHLSYFLFSPFHGVLPWTPIVFMGVAGLAMGVAKNERGAMLLILLFAMQIWIDSGSRPVFPGHVLGSRSWSAGTSFGPRKLLDAIPLLLPGALWLRDWANTRARAGALIVATVMLILPSTLLHAAAFVDFRVTEAVLDWPHFGRMIISPFNSDAWAKTFHDRALPLSVTLAVATATWTLIALGGVIVTFGARLGARLETRSRGQRPTCLKTGAICLLASALVAHVWLGMLKLRSDTILAGDPDRMAAVAAQMWPPHVRIIKQAAAYRANLRAKFGADAAPP